MWTRITLLGCSIGFVVASSELALAACYYQATTNGAEPGGVLIMVLLITGLIFAVCMSTSEAEREEDDETGVPEIEPEHFDREAAALRALTRATEAETALKHSQIENARAWAEYQEIEELIKHDKRTRQLGSPPARR